MEKAESAARGKHLDPFPYLFPKVICTQDITGSVNMEAFFPQVEKNIARQRHGYPGSKIGSGCRLLYYEIIGNYTAYFDGLALQKCR